MIVQMQATFFDTETDEQIGVFVASNIENDEEFDTTFINLICDNLINHIFTERPITVRYDTIE